MAMPPGLVLRAQESEDEDALWELYNLPKVQSQTLTPPYISRAQVRERLAAADPNRHAIVALLDGVLVGQATLTVYRGRRAHAGSLGMFVRDDYTGRGIGTALLQAIIDLAERWLGLWRLELDVFSDNAAALHLYAKMGFVIEGTKRRYALRDGAYVDTHLMARVRGPQA